MKSQEAFEAFFQDELIQTIKKLEAKRRGVLMRMWAVGILGLVLITGVMVLFSTVYFMDGALSHTYQIFLGVALSVVIGGACGMVIYEIFNNKTFYMQFKTRVIARIVKFIDPHLHYNARRYVKPAQFKDSLIFRTPPGKHYKGDDFVWGRLHDKLQIEFSEIESPYSRRVTLHNALEDEDTIEERIIFKGLFFIALAKEPFKAAAVVTRPDVAAVGTPLLQPVIYGDRAFINNFKVFADYPDRIQEYLTPEVCQALVRFQERRQDPIYLSFNGQKVFIGVSYSKDLFEPHVFKSLLEYDLIAEYYHDLSEALGIVEQIFGGSLGMDLSDPEVLPASSVAEAAPVATDGQTPAAAATPPVQDEEA